MRPLCLGGTFDPVHHGHLACGRAAAEAGGFDGVVLIPAFQSPHKQGLTASVSADHRLAMCRAAVAGDAGFAVSEVETSRPTPSFTIDTARSLRRQGFPEVSWLIGADQLHRLSTWHDAPALLAEVAFVVMARPGWTTDWSTLPPIVRPLRDRVVTVPQLQISSTDLRRRLAAGQPIRYLTPDPVIDYVRAHGLYRS